VVPKHLLSGCASGLLAAAACPFVSVASIGWFPLACWLAGLLVAHVAETPFMRLNRGPRVVWIMLCLTILVLRPEDPLVLALVGTSLIGLLLIISAKGQRMAAPWLMVGVIGLAAVATASLWVWWRSKGFTFGMEPLAQTLSVALRVCSVSARAEQESLWLGVNGTNEVLVTPEALGWPYLVLWVLTVGGWMVMESRPVGWRLAVAAGAFLLIEMAVFLLRALAVVDGFWPAEVLPLSAWQFGWLVPVGVWLAIWVQRPFRPEVGVKRIGSTTWEFAAVILAMVMIGMGLFFPYTSAYRPLRVLIDDGHGPWESTTVPVDTASYGRLSLYNYTLLAQWLRVHHQVDVTAPDTPIPEDLTPYHVILLKTPARDYGADEIERLRRYVEHGGGLLLIADHTNLFGHTQRLNAVAAPYGLSFRLDATFPWPQLNAPYVHQPSRSAAGDVLLNGLGPFAVLTAASVVDRSVWGMPFVRTTRAVSERADYSNMNYFGPLRMSAEDRVGPLAFAAATPYGAGKVVMWGESTMWSSFSLFHPEYPELILRLLAYAGSPSTHRLGQLVAVVGLVSLVLVLSRVYSSQGSMRAWQLALLAVPLGGVLAVSVPLQPAWPDLTLRVPSAVRTVTVDFDHSHVSLRIDSTRAASSEREVYTAFYGWLGRLNVWPFPLRGQVSLVPGRPRTSVACTEPRQTVYGKRAYRHWRLCTKWRVTLRVR
jgi:hypothetical protein